MTFLDIAIILLLLLCLWGGYRKGFVLTLCGFLALFVALIGAFFCSSLLAQPVANAITPMLENTVHQALDEYIDSAVLENYALPEGLELPDGFDISQLPIDAIPVDEIAAALQDNPLLQRLSESFDRAMNSGAIDATLDIAGALAGFIALQISRIVIFILAFLAFTIAWFLLSHALDLAFKLPVLSTLNAVSGAALGLVKGLVLVYIAVWLLKDGFIPAEMMDGSLLFPFFAAGPALLFSMISQ